MERCEINCPDINAVHVVVPELPSNAYAEWLATKNLNLSRTIRVWPAGFPGRQWDGEGRSDWLTTERPCFGVVSDHDVEAYDVTLDGAETLTINANRSGTPTFLQLQELSPGKHLLTIRAHRGGLSSEGTPSHEGFLELRVRKPMPWIPGAASHAGLIASGDPHDATLDTFWENEFALSVLGPPSRQVTPHVILQNASEETIYEKEVCGPLDLPVTPAVWKNRFRDFLRREKCEWQYLEASSGFLSLDGGDLGRYVMRFEHDVRPLRWALSQDAEGMSIRLVDETAQEEIERQCYFSHMEQPRSFIRLDIDAALKGMPVESPGGLFIAKAGNNIDAVVVSTGLTGEGLEGLGVVPSHGHISDAPQSIIKLLRVLRYWHKARVAGYLASARRRQVTDTLIHGLTGSLAGWDWARVEAKLNSSEDSSGLMDRLQSLVAPRPGFASAIRRNAPSISGGRGALSSWYAAAAKRYRISSDQALCHFGIEFAARPHALPLLFKEDLPDLLSRARANQPLIRGARFAVLSKMRTPDEATMQLVGATA